MSTVKKPKGISLKDVPEDVFKILINEQTKIKLEKGCAQFGIEHVIYKLIRQSAKAS